jgi:hypothetical protein
MIAVMPINNINNTIRLFQCSDSDSSNTIFFNCSFLCLDWVGERNFFYQFDVIFLDYFIGFFHVDKLVFSCSEFLVGLLD